MKPWIRNTLIAFGLLLLVPIVGALVLTQLYGNKLKQLLLQELNNELLTQVEINGDAAITFWKTFPLASLEVKNIVIYGSAPYQKKKILVCNKAYFEMDILDAINQRWNIKAITLEQADIILFKDIKGKINYRFIKEDTTATTQEMQFNITKATLKKVLLKYEDETQQIAIHNIFKSAVLQGDFKKSQLSLQVKTESIIQHITLEDESYLKEKAINISGSIKANASKNEYRVKTDKIIIEDNQLTFNGLFSPQKNGTQVNIDIKTQQGKLEQIIALLPPKLTESISALNLKGDVNGSINVEGWMSANSNPFINANIKVSNSSFEVSAIQSQAKNIAANIHFNNGSAKNHASSTLKIENLKGQIAGNDINGYVMVKNFNNPDIDIQYKGNLDIGILQPFIINDKIQSISGLLRIENFTLKSNWQKLQQLQHADDLQLQASMQIENIEALVKNEKMRIATGNLRVDEKSIQLQNTEIDALESNIKGHIQCDNWKQFLFALKKPETISANQLIIQSNLEANQLNWNKWQQFFKAENSSATTSNTSNTFNRNQAANLGGKAKVKINSFQFDAFKAEKLGTELTFTPNQIFLHNLNFEAVNGEADAKGYFAFKDRKLEINFSLVTRKADIKKLFNSFNNFKQTAITADNLEGTLTSDIKFSALWNKGVFDENSLYVYADVKIENGKLINYKPLESLSRFVKLEELKNVKFGTLKNTIEIKNGVITIPKMLINSSVLNIAVTGTQSFSGNINYGVKLNLFDVLGKKFGRNKQQFEFEEPDENSFNLFLSVTGTTDNPIVNYDRTGMKEKLKQQKDDFKNYKEGTQQPYNKSKETKDWETKEELEEIKWD